MDRVPVSTDGSHAHALLTNRPDEQAALRAARGPRASGMSRSSRATVIGGRMLHCMRTVHRFSVAFTLQSQHARPTARMLTLRPGRATRMERKPLAMLIFVYAREIIADRRSHRRLLALGQVESRPRDGDA